MYLIYNYCKLFELRFYRWCRNWVSYKSVSNSSKEENRLEDKFDLLVPHLSYFIGKNLYTLLQHLNTRWRIYLLAFQILSRLIRFVIMTLWLYILYNEETNNKSTFIFYLFFQFRIDIWFVAIVLWMCSWFWKSLCGFVDMTFGTPYTTLFRENLRSNLLKTNIHV